MNSRQMLARFASGGDVSEGMKYATGEGGIGAAQYYANIRKFVNEKGSELDASQMRAEMDKYGVSDRDVRDALAGTQYSAGAVHALLNKDIGAENAPGRGVGGLQGMSANIKAYVDSLAAQAKSGDLSQKQVTDILAAQLGTYDPKAGVGGFNELDLQRATGKTSAELLKDMFPSRFTPPPIPSVPEPIAMPPITERPVEPIRVPPIDMAFRGSEQRTWDPVSRSFTYTPAASLQPATGSGLDFVPPVVTSRPRGLLNVRPNDIDPSTGKPLYQEGYDASTRTYTPAVSASTMNAEARRVLLSALSAGLAGKNIGTVDYYRLLNQARAGAFGNPSDPGFVQRISIEADKLKPITTYTSSPTTPGASSTSGPPGLAISGVGGTPPPGTTLPSDIEPPKPPGPLFSQGGPVLKKSDGGDVSRGTLPPKLPPGVQRAVDKAQGSRTVLPVPGVGETRQFLSGFVGASPDYSVMDPNYKALGSSYRAGEQAAVASEVFGAMTPFATASTLARAKQIPGVSQLIAYHGTPKSEVFRAFDPKYIKTGEGNTQYGYGFYFAENPQVSGTYKRMESEYKRMTGGLDPKTERAYDFMAQGLNEPEILSRLSYYYGSELSFDDAMKAVNQAKQHFNVGRLYKVDIDDAKIAKMLDWDAPLGEQSTVIQNLAKQYKLNSDDLGGDLVHAMKAKTPEGAKLMSEAGVPGIKYLDQGSRGLPQIKKQFLEELDPDASTEEVMDLLGKKVFSAKNEALLRELNNNDWLGFDYPSQAISEVFRAGFFRSNPDITEGLKKAVSAARQPDKGTRNIVVFPGEESSIKMLEVDGAPIEKKRGGEVSTKDFIAKFVDGSPNPDEVPSVIDEREEIRSESQRMLNRLSSQSKLPPGLQRTIQGARARQGESMIPAAVPARDVMAGMFGAQAMNPGSEAYRTGQALANSPPVEVLKAPAKIASAAGDAATALASLGGAGVIKSKGGNWFKDLNSVEGQLQWLKSSPTVRQNPPDVLERMIGPGKMALDNWVDKKLTKYIKNEMGTPEDPIRELAERGILHFPIYDFNAVGLGEKRQQAGMPIGLQGQSREAQFWEQTADRLIDFTTPSKIKREATHGAKEHQRNYAKDLLEENPWIEKVPANTKIYKPSVSDDLVDNAGFGHIIDELENAMHPESDLPNALRIQPKDLEKMTVPQAVEKVAKINEWRAKEALKAEREGMLRNLQATPRLADNSLQLSFVDKPGGSWVDIPETTDPKGLALCTSIGRAGGWCTQGDYLAESYGSGEHRLTALVDAEGRPHAQAKITENDWPVSGEGFTRLDPQTKAQYGQYVREWRQRNPEVEELTDDDVIQALKEAGVKGPAPDITELKPPGNSFDSERAMEYAKRDPDYKAKVTDSVVRFLNSGEWGDVRDLRLYDIVDLERGNITLDGYLRGITGSRSGRAVLDKALKAQPTAPRFMTLDQFTKFLGYKNGGEVKLKHGGPVDKTTAFIKAHA